MMFVGYDVCRLMTFVALLCLSPTWLPPHYCHTPGSRPTAHALSCYGSGRGRTNGGPCWPSSWPIRRRVCRLVGEDPRQENADICWPRERKRKREKDWAMTQPAPTLGQDSIPAITSSFSPNVVVVFQLAIWQVRWQSCRAFHFRSVSVNAGGSAGCRAVDPHSFFSDPDPAVFSMQIRI